MLQQWKQTDKQTNRKQLRLWQLQTFLSLFFSLLLSRSLSISVAHLTFIWTCIDMCVHREQYGGALKCWDGVGQVEAVGVKTHRLQLCGAPSYLFESFCVHFVVRANCQIGLMALMRIRVPSKPAASPVAAAAPSWHQRSLQRPSVGAVAKQWLRDFGQQYCKQLCWQMQI